MDDRQNFALNIINDNFHTAIKLFALSDSYYQLIETSFKTTSQNIKNILYIITFNYGISTCDNYKKYKKLYVDKYGNDENIKYLSKQEASTLDQYYSEDYKKRLKTVTDNIENITTNDLNFFQKEAPAGSLLSQTYKYLTSSELDINWLNQTPNIRTGSFDVTRTSILTFLYIATRKNLSGIKFTQLVNGVKTDQDNVKINGRYFFTNGGPGIFDKTLGKLWVAFSSQNRQKGIIKKVLDLFTSTNQVNLLNPSFIEKFSNKSDLIIPTLGAPFSVAKNTAPKKIESEYDHQNTAILTEPIINQLTSSVKEIEETTTSSIFNQNKEEQEEEEEQEEQVIKEELKKEEAEKDEENYSLDGYMKGNDITPGNLTGELEIPVLTVEDLNTDHIDGNEDNEIQTNTSFKNLKTMADSISEIIQNKNSTDPNFSELSKEEQNGIALQEVYANYKDKLSAGLQLNNSEKEQQKQEEKREHIYEPSLINKIKELGKKTSLLITEKASIIAEYLKSRTFSANRIDEFKKKANEVLKQVANNIENQKINDTEAGAGVIRIVGEIAAFSPDDDLLIAGEINNSIKKEENDQTFKRFIKDSNPENSNKYVLHEIPSNPDPYENMNAETSEPDEELEEALENVPETQEGLESTPAPQEDPLSFNAKRIVPGFFSNESVSNYTKISRNRLIHKKLHSVF